MRKGRTLEAIRHARADQLQNVLYMLQFEADFRGGGFTRGIYGERLEDLARPGYTMRHRPIDERDDALQLSRRDLAMAGYNDAAAQVVAQELATDLATVITAMVEHGNVEQVAEAMRNLAQQALAAGGDGEAGDR